MSELFTRASALVATDPAQALTLAETLSATTTGAALARSHQLRSRALRALGRHDDALAALTAAAAAADTPLLAAQVQLGAIDTLGMLGRYAEAEALGHTLAATLQQHGATLDAAKALGNLGSLALRQDNYPTALERYAAAEALLADDAPLVRAGLALNQAIALTYLGRADDALARYHQAQQLYENSASPFEAAVAQANRGFLYQTTGRYALALAEFTAAHTRFIEHQRPHEAARCDLDTGDAYRALNLLAEAEQCYTRALATFAENPLPDDEARAHIGLAAVALAQGTTTTVAAALSTAERHFETVGNAPQCARVLLLRAQLAADQGQPERAQQLAQESTARFAAAGLPAWQAEAELLTEPSVERLHALSALADQKGLGSLAWRVERTLGQRYAATGNRSAAISHLRRAVERLESARAQLAPEELHLAFLRDKEQVYGELAALLLTDNATEAEQEEALQVIERSRSRLLLERLLSAQLAQPTAATTALAQLRATLSQAYRSALALPDNEPSRTLAPHPPQPLAALEAAYASALRASELQSAFPQTTLQSAPPALAALQAALPETTTLLLYAALGEQLAAFVLTRERLQVIPQLANRAEVAHVARRFRYHLQKLPAAPLLRDAPLLEELETVLARLQALLIAPLEPLLTGTELVVVPCRPLHGLPFHAFPDRGQTLQDRFELTYAPSAAIWQTLTQRPTPPPTSAPPLLVGVPGPGTEQVAAELEAITAELPAQVLCGNSATVAAVQARLADTPLLHFATHAFFRHDNPLFSGLQLADDWLLARDLYGLPLRAALVTLSACDTGAARIDAGEEWMGLARGFLSAGAERVLVSLWPADDRATAELMATFYRKVQEGEPPTRALRAAQREQRARRPHPYYWAAFCLIGKY